MSCGWERGRRRCLASGCESIRINSDQAALLFSENSRKLLVDPIHSDRFGSAVRRELEGCLLKDVEWGGGGGGGGRGQDPPSPPYVKVSPGVFPSLILVLIFGHGFSVGVQ